MPYFGAHMSISGGYDQAVAAADAHGMEACQLFTKNNQQWRARPISDAEAAAFRAAVRRSSVRKLLAHASYLINLAAADDEVYHKSIDALVTEVHRAEQLRLDAIVVHPGGHGGAGEEAGLARIVSALDEVHRRRPRSRVRILLETTAGQGNSLGHRFDHLSEVLRRVRAGSRLGVCFDTCHVFAAGYPLAPRRNYLATMREFDRLVGLDRIEAIHLNDSVQPLGSRVDRHAGIGRGRLGLEPFALLLNDRRFHALPMILETPKGTENGRDLDEINLEVLRGLAARQP